MVGTIFCSLSYNQTLLYSIQFFFFFFFFLGGGGGGEGGIFHISWV